MSAFHLFDDTVYLPPPPHSVKATSRLLVNYAEPYRSQILDYLFKVRPDDVKFVSLQNISVEHVCNFVFSAVFSQILELHYISWRWRLEEMLRPPVSNKYSLVFLLLWLLCLTCLTRAALSWSWSPENSCVHLSFRVKVLWWNRTVDTNDNIWLESQSMCCHSWFMFS